MSETAIIVPVYEVEQTIDLIRRQHTKSGGEGMPSHVTLLYPFTDSTLLVAGRIHEVEDMLAAFESFNFDLTSVAYFQTTPRTMYLTPDPEAPFAEMTNALVSAFPEHQPYGGAHPTVTPHVTVAVADDDALGQIEEKVVAELPINARASEVMLMQRDDKNMWFELLRFDLTA